MPGRSLRFRADRFREGIAQDASASAKLADAKLADAKLADATLWQAAMRVGIAGAAGRMGRLVAAECLAQGSIVAGGTLRGGGLAQEGTRIFGSMQALAAASDVVVDFTSPDAVDDHALALAEAKVAWVLGTTGLSAGQQRAVAAAARAIPVVQAANFSPGMVLVMAAARVLARALPASGYDAEILEMHHRQKQDAPSGTAIALSRAVAEGRGLDPASLRAGHDRSGARQAGAIGFASLRGGQVAGRHSVLFAGADEHITLSHEALDRRVFAAGALRAAVWADGREPGLYGMEDVLGLDAASEGAT